MEYTQQQVDELLVNAKAEWDSTVLLPLQSELDKIKPKESTEHEQEIEKLKAQINQQNMISTFRELGFTDFEEIVQADNPDELKSKLGKLQSALDKRQLTNSFQPVNHKQTDKYEQALKSGNITEAIDVKLSKLFN